MSGTWKVTGRAAGLVMLLGLAGAGAARAGAPTAALAPGAHRVQRALADPTLKEPYLLFTGEPTRMEVLWQLTTTATSTIEWGPDTSCALGSASSDEYGIDHQHAYVIEGLTPGTKYFYRVWSEGVPHRGSFMAAPDPAATRLKFLAYGDTRSNPGVHDAVASAMISTFTADTTYQSLALVVGDLVFNGESEADWTGQFFSPAYPNIRRFMASVPYQSCIGNHEGTGGLFRKYFPYPYVTPHYWSFDYGPAHFAVVDEYQSFAPGSAQLLWLAADLAASTRPWKFIALHEPGWSAGGRYPNNVAVQNYIQPLCKQYGVAMVFAGHNHFYARALVNGVQHITTGGGGAPIAVPAWGPPYLVTGWGDYHFCKIAIDGDSLSFTALTLGGQTADAFGMRVPDLIPPSIALGSPAGGADWFVGSLETVAWTASDNVVVDSVNVDYSVTGVAGPWRAIVHGAPGVGSVLWSVPMETTDSARVRVTAFDHSLNATSALSDGFRIVLPDLDAGGGARSGLALARPQPNPGSGTITFGFTLPEAGRARLEILDLSGRLIWRTEQLQGAGAHAWRWDGRTAQGAPAGSGLYFVRLVTPWGVRAEQFVRLR